jgi:hypothetical protein
MASQIGWLDFSEDQQQKILESLKGFETKDTVDDLGFGSIRDAISGVLFPGTSVLQTRARYFLFIPWIFQEAYQRNPKKMLDHARRLELKLIAALKESDDTSGVIGIDRGFALKTVPSSIYWSGLRAFGIFKIPGRSIQQYGRLAQKNYEEAEFEGEFAGGGSPFWCEMPPPPADFMNFNFAEMRMTSTEAEWLSGRILRTSSEIQPNLLSHFVRDLMNSQNSFLNADYVWDVALSDEVDSRIRLLTNLHSKNFSHLAQMSAFLYNAMLVEKLQQLGREISFADDYIERLNKKVSEVKSSQEFLKWCEDSEQFFECLTSLGVKPSPTSVEFVKSLTSFISQRGIGEFSTHPEIRMIIERREIQNKPRQARLASDSRLFAYHGEAGTGLMTYRWDLVKRILKDIDDGLKGESD